MPNYQEGKIYKIYNVVNDDFYVGSTTRKLSERMADHRACIHSKKSQHLLIYKAFREHGVESFYIELIEKCPCHDIEELRKKEGEYIRQLKPSLNKFIAGRTKQEYYENNKEYINEHMHEYYENNKEYIIEQHKQYNENNKEHIKAQKKQYWEVNKDYFKAITGEKVECECGCIVTRHSIPRHKRTTKHNQLMKDKLN